MLTALLMTALMGAGGAFVSQAQAQDSDGDGLLDSAEGSTRDSDNDTRKNFQDYDDDGDGVWTRDELADPNGNGSPDDAVDSDGDGTPDYLDNKDLTVVRVDESALAINPQTRVVDGILTVTIANVGNMDVEPVLVRAFRDIDGDGAYTAGVDADIGSASAPGTLQGRQQEVKVRVRARLDFVGEKIFALVDAANVVREGRENNNVGDSLRSRLPLAANAVTYDAKAKWHWSGGAAATEHVSVMMVPAVANLNDDNGDGRVDALDVPDVIFSSFKDRTHHRDGILWAVDGRTGETHWPLTDPPYRTTASGGVAVAELDATHDGPEIVVCEESEADLSAASSVLIVSAEGTLIRRVGGVRCGATAPFVADVDRDGVPEIAVRYALIRADGTVLFSKKQDPPYFSLNKDSTILVDLDGDGDLELVGGTGAYQHNGAVLWERGSGEGFVAAADVNGNGLADVLVVESAEERAVALNGRTGEPLWPSPVSLGVASSNGTAGSPPAIVELDGDRGAEAVIGGADRLTALNVEDGSILWRNSNVADTSSGTMSAIGFAFSGNAPDQVVYNDETKLHILAPENGSELESTCSRTGSVLDGPIVADVDLDGEAEIVVGNNTPGSACSSDIGTFGLTVWESADGRWAGARPIWNQHGFWPSTVTDDGVIRSEQTAPWLRSNAFRAQVSEPVLDRPDLTVSYVRADMGGYPEAIEFTVRIGNGGTLPIDAGSDVGFYDGDPNDSGVLLGTTSVGYLAPGQFRDVKFRWTTPPDTVTQRSETVWVRADTGEVIEEINEIDEVVLQYPVGQDADDDGIEDSADFDADNDGIPNAAENDGNDPMADRNNNGVEDWRDSAVNGFVDNNGDDVDDRFDTDGDGVPNHLDVDSDNDGVPDIVENRGAKLDIDRDGRVDAPLDRDGDGVSDQFDANDFDRGVTGTIELVLDTDGSGPPDFKDLDADADGIADVIEGGGIDAAGTGQVVGFIDTNGDGLSDTPTPLAAPDTDGDGALDLQDTDSDGDGLLDRVEGHDANHDGRADRLPLGQDIDDDGLDDAFDANAPMPGTSAAVPDRDDDGLENFRDADDDNDRIPTRTEVEDSGRLSPPRPDLDRDGLVSWYDTDSDGDTIGDQGECPTGVNCPDADGDGVPGYLDADEVPADEDGDGVPDAVECPDRDACADTDGDGLDDWMDDDDDGDTLPTREERLEGVDVDTDNDGRPDHLDADDDDDTLLTRDEKLDADEFGDDVDMDGIFNWLDKDSDADGIPDAVEGRDNDADGDRIPDYLDATEGGGRFVGGASLFCKLRTHSAPGGGVLWLLFVGAFSLLRVRTHRRVALRARSQLRRR